MVLRFVSEGVGWLVSGEEEIEDSKRKGSFRGEGRGTSKFFLSFFLGFAFFLFGFVSAFANLFLYFSVARW